jgi:hypothetical protein
MQKRSIPTMSGNFFSVKDKVFLDLVPILSGGSENGQWSRCGIGPNLDRSRSVYGSRDLQKTAERSGASRKAKETSSAIGTKAGQGEGAEGRSGRKHSGGRVRF